MTPGLQVAGALVASVSRATLRASNRMLGLQHADGFWQGDVTDYSLPEANWILLQLWLHPPQAGVWNFPMPDQLKRAARSILERQLPEGGYKIYPAGPTDVSASVMAYFALKLAGITADSEAMTKLRERILTLGGIQAAKSNVKINLSLFGLYPRDHVPTAPPEMMLLGKLPYRLASWTRATLVPLSIIQALMRAGRPVPAGFTIQELFVPGAPADLQSDVNSGPWNNMFLGLDRFLNWWERHGSRSIRRKAIHKAKEWMLARLECSDGLGAINAPMMYSVMALDLLGAGPNSPERSRALSYLERLPNDSPNRSELQPVRDTAITMFALGASGSATPEALDGATRWLLAKEVRRSGDWSIMRPKVEPSGWCSEPANEFYPSIENTAMVLLALAHSREMRMAGLQESAQRAIGWLLAMQSRDGGWASFDVDNNWKFLSKSSFADSGLMLDSTWPDITGRVLEALARWGQDPAHAAIRRGIKYLLKSQETDGSWIGRCGVAYIYGTCLALRGLHAVGYDDHEAEVLRAGEWLRSVQNADGGWGESCSSYDRKSFVSAPSTASQTAWAVLGLLAGGDTTSESVSKGIEYLIASQREDGGWDEALATSTGLPGVLYQSCQVNSDSFPMLALAEFQRIKSAEAESRPALIPGVPGAPR